MKHSLNFYRENWNQPLIQHINKMINFNTGTDEEFAKFIVDLSPVGNTYEDSLHMIESIKKIKKEKDGEDNE